MRVLLLAVVIALSAGCVVYVPDLGTFDCQLVGDTWSCVQISPVRRSL